MKTLILTIFILCSGFAIACNIAEHTPAPTPVNNNPVIVKIEYTKDVFNGAETELNCVAEDSDGDRLTYIWTAEKGSIAGSGSSVSWLPPADLGTYPVKVTVRDSRGGEAVETINIRVLTNTDGTATPKVTLKLKLGQTPELVVVKSRVRSYFTTEIYCVVEKAGSDNLHYRWAAAGGKLKATGLDDGTAYKVGWIAPGVAGNYTVSVTVTDDQNRESKSEVNFEVFCCGN